VERENDQVKCKVKKNLKKSDMGKREVENSGTEHQDGNQRGSKPTMVEHCTLEKTMEL